MKNNNNRCAQTDPLRCSYPHCSCMGMIPRTSTSSGMNKAAFAIAGIVCVLILTALPLFIDGLPLPGGGPEVAEVSEAGVGSFGSPFPCVPEQRRLWGGLHDGDYKRIELVRYGYGPWLALNQAGQVLGEADRVAPYADPLNAIPIDPIN